MTAAKPRLRVLLVEDDANDVLFFQMALRSRRAEIDLEVAGDGAAAVRRLEAGPPPDRVILDLKLPLVSGIEVLAWIRSNPALRHLSVIIMSSSGEPNDLARIEQLGIDEYIVKPVSYQGLLDIVGGLCAKWS
jgi:CheY-like chemotaxis protein